MFNCFCCLCSFVLLFLCAFVSSAAVTLTVTALAAANGGGVVGGVGVEKVSFLATWTYSSPFLSGF